jgi:hypothetical protein
VGAARGTVGEADAGDLARRLPAHGADAVEDRGERGAQRRRPGGLDPREVGRVLVGHFLDLWEENEVLTVLLRVGVTNPDGAERMQGIFRDQLMPVALRVCPDPEQAPARAALTASQVLGMAMARYVLRFQPAVALPREEVVAWPAPTVQRYLTAPHP